MVIVRCCWNLWTNRLSTLFAPSKKEVLAQVIEDATDAYNLLPWADAEGKVTNDYGRASKGAAGHLLAKAYMYRYSQKWAGTQK